ncbi:MAG TPA: HD domain-containing protein [Candidatus Paceibacterota bacterium]|nr:HD domain-containing protein [Candidatus Paceibacterota bacterium]HMO82760.1 HD domain-containing protein [Candidatus Paceibacterota bacterium]
MNSLDTFRNLFPVFYNQIKNGHIQTKNKDHFGHGFDHDVTVAMLAVLIAPSVRLGHKAWCASLLHSTDRVVTEKKVKETMILYSQNLKHFFNDTEIKDIIEAALRHSELNQDNQNDTQVVLMDADRLANMQSAVIIRGGQFRHKIPALDLKYLNGDKNPLSTYENPKTVLDNLRLIISQYIPQLRIKKAKVLGSVYSKKIKKYIESIERDYEKLGLAGVDL